MKEACEMGNRRGQECPGVNISPPLGELESMVKHCRNRDDISDKSQPQELRGNQKTLP